MAVFCRMYVFMGWSMEHVSNAPVDCTYYEQSTNYLQGIENARSILHLRSTVDLYK